MGGKTPRTIWHAAFLWREEPARPLQEECTPPTAGQAYWADEAILDATWTLPKIEIIENVGAPR
jgi:hypothetical protein